MCAFSGNNFYCEMDSRAFTRAGLTGNGLVARLGADGSRRLLAQRLARRLLLARMRPGTDTATVTHASLSHTLGVRRSGVTVFVGVLGRDGLLTRGRGSVRVRECVGAGGRSRAGVTGCSPTNTATLSTT